MFRWFYGDSSTKPDTTVTENKTVEEIDKEYVLVNGTKVPDLIAKLQKASAETETKTPNPTKFRSSEFVAKLNAIETVLSQPSSKIKEMLERSKVAASQSIATTAPFLKESTFKITSGPILQDVHAELISRMKPPLRENLKVIFLAGQYRASYLKESYAQILRRGLENKITANQQLNAQITATPNEKVNNSNINTPFRTR